MFLSTTNIPPAHDTWQSYLYPPCTVHNEAQHRRVDTSQYLNELISNSESQKPTQQFKIQSSISNNNAHENWKPPKKIFQIKNKTSQINFELANLSSIVIPFSHTHPRVETRTY